MAPGAPRASRSRISSFLVVFTIIAGHFFPPVLRAQESNIRLDPVRTTIEFTLASTLHTVHGTFELKGGTIHFDASTGKAGGAIVVNTASGQSGNKGRDKKMHNEILESELFPEIIFTPSRVKGDFAATGTSRMEVSGQFRLHGQDHDFTLPIDVQPMGREVQLSSHFTIPYIQWGLKNPSTFMLRAGNNVEINIHAAGEIVEGRPLQ